MKTRREETIESSTFDYIISISKDVVVEPFEFFVKLLRESIDGIRIAQIQFHHLHDAFILTVTAFTELLNLLLGRLRSLFRPAG